MLTQRFLGEEAASLQKGGLRTHMKLKGKIARMKVHSGDNLYLMLFILLRMIPQVRHILCPKFPIKVRRSRASREFARAETGSQESSIRVHWKEFIA